MNNPELPLIVFASEDSYNDEYAYFWVEDVHCRIEELAIYDNIYMDKDDYKEKVYEKIFETSDTYNESFIEQEVNKIMSNVKFVKAIVLWVG